MERCSVQPHNLLPVGTIAKQCKGLPRIACFDTTFHQTAPKVARAFEIDLFRVPDRSLNRLAGRGAGRS
jgi:acetate kinase